MKNRERKNVYQKTIDSLRNKTYNLVNIKTKETLLLNNNEIFVQVVTAFHLKLKGGKIMKQTSSQPRLDGKIPGRIKYTFALGALGKDMIYGMIATFSMIYFTDIIKVNPVFIGVMFFVAKLWDAFNDLFMGMIVDNTRSRWGKFIPWLVIGTLVNSIVFVVLFTDFHLDGVGLCVFATAAYILWV